MQLTCQDPVGHLLAPLRQTLLPLLGLSCCSLLRCDDGHLLTEVNGVCSFIWSLIIHTHELTSVRWRQTTWEENTCQSTCLLLCASCTHLSSDAPLQLTPQFTQWLLLLSCASPLQCAICFWEQSPFVLKTWNLLLDPKNNPKVRTCWQGITSIRGDEE